MLDPDWIADADFDVFHLQFGFDAWSPERLRDVVGALRRRGKPLVYTVHDLRNPHHEDRTMHDAQLDVLVPAADALVTLTAGAAREIGDRWGRRAHVVPHPHVVDFATMTRLPARPRSEEVRIGLHVKSLRASMDPGRLLPALLRFATTNPGTVLQVNGHRDVLEPGGARYCADLARPLREAAAAGARRPAASTTSWPTAELLRLPRLARRRGPALPLRHPLRLAGGVSRPRHDRGGAQLRLLRRPGTGRLLPQRGRDRFDPDSFEQALATAVDHPGLGRLSVAARRAQRTEIFEPSTPACTPTSSKPEGGSRSGVS